MKTIEVDEDLYRFIASRTQHIGESASDILRRLLALTPVAAVTPSASLLRTDSALQPMAAVTGECQPEALEQLLAQAGFAEKESAIDRF